MMKKFINLLCLSGIGCLISGISLIFIPLVDLSGSTSQKVFAMIVAAVFWLGLVTEIVFFILANRQCKAIEKGLTKKNGKSFKNAPVGVISFFQCREAMVADIISALSLVVLIMLIIFNVSNDWIFVCFAVTFFLSFNIHCFLNGKNYKYLKEYKKYLKKQGAKKDE